jgi:hypothetical protein
MRSREGPTAWAGAGGTAAVLAEYERRNRYLAPVLRRALSWLVGWRYDGTEAKRRQLVGELPMVALRPGDAQ